MIGEMIFVKELEKKYAGKIKRRWAEFKCTCGNIIEARISHVTYRKIISCGCLRVKRIANLNLSHGCCTKYNRTSEYSTWCRMIQRCRNENDPKYYRYGGRGIKICERWLNFENFLNDMGVRPGKNYSIDRINNDGNYESANCRWATPQQQMRNTSRNKDYTYEGVTRKLPEWAEIFSMNLETLRRRLKYGWDLNKAFTVPVKTNIL